MKKSNPKWLVLLVILIVGLNVNITAQVSQVGNGAPGIATDYCGWNATRPFPFTLAHKGNFPMNFQTNGVQRMTIMNNTGFVGIGLANPQFRLHLENDGGILSSNNTFGAGVNIPGGLNGPLLIWSTKKASFRAGVDNIGAWSNALTGNYSVAFGQDNEASGNYSVSWGEGNVVSGNRSFGIGLTNSILSNRSYVMGDQNQINANGSVCIGNTNIMNGSGFILGSLNTIDPTGSGYIFGTNNFPMSGVSNFLFGTQNQVDGRNSFTFGEGHLISANSLSWSVTMGTGSLNNAGSSFALGNYIVTDGTGSFAFGERVRTTLAATSSFAFGKGFNPATPFTNSIANSFMVGFNSDVSTFTVVAPTVPGLGATGRVGIANSAPTHKLDINGDLRVRVTPMATPNCLLVGTNQTGPDDNQVSRLDFTGNSNQILLGNGTWGNIPSAALFANNGATITNILGQDYVQWGQVNTSIGTLNGGELLHDTEIPFNGFNVLFQDPAVSNSGQNRMQVGPFFGPTLYNQNAKFSSIHAENSTSVFRIGGFFSTTGAFNVSAIPNIDVRPLYFQAIVPTFAGILSIAADFNNTSSHLVGVEGAAYSLTAQKNIGISGKSYGSSVSNYGIYSIAEGVGPSSNYGIWASASGGSYNVAAYFSGDIDGTGTNNYASDINLKQNINGIVNADDILSQLIPVSFEFNSSSFPQMNFSSGTKYGLIAQDVETVLPEVVKNSIFPAQYDSLGNMIHAEVNYKSLNYESMIPFLIKGHQEQQSIIDSLQNLLSNQDSINNELYSMINSCCSNESRMSQDQSNSLDLTLTDKSPNIILDQNVPNPFAEQTTITYNLTDGIKKAQMLFYNIEGKLIQVVDLSNATGKGQINVFANDLSTGVYTYSLVVDGEIKGTKRMVKE
jgi:hypothetical protein